VEVTVMPMTTDMVNPSMMMATAVMPTPMVVVLSRIHGTNEIHNVIAETRWRDESHCSGKTQS